MSDSSLNEVRALALKAARGAGLSWGLAEEAGAATRWLEARGAPGVETLARYLLWRDGLSQAALTPADVDGVWQAPGGVICPLTLGALICDTPAILLQFTARSVTEPDLVTPFIAWSGMRVSLVWDDLPAAVPRDVSAIPEALVSRDPGHRARPAPGDLATLERFAARTYAPTTEASRRCGAGGGNANED